MLFADDTPRRWGCRSLSWAFKHSVHGPAYPCLVIGGPLMLLSPASPCWVAIMHGSHSRGDDCPHRDVSSFMKMCSHYNLIILRCLPGFHCEYGHLHASMTGFTVWVSE